jgi:hypothetical protein
MPQTASWFHAHQDTIGRSSGRTATGIASYVTGQRIKDDETGKWLKRNHPGDVLAFGTTAPEGAPEHLTDNSQLARAWNEAQQADSRKNAQLARHWNIALSRDLTIEEQVGVMKAIAQAFTDRYGTMATWAVHSPTDHGDDRNAHGHIVHNMRMVTPDGFGPKVLEPVVFKTAKREMEWARGMIAAQINDGLERAGLDERVSHLSYETQGVDREPKRHLGDKQNQAELKGEATPTGDHNRAVDDRNAERDAEAKANQAQEAQLTAEIIDLQEERSRRNQGLEPAQATDEDARRQAERQKEWYHQAGEAHKEQQREHSTQRLVDDGKRQADEHRQDQAKRQKEQEARRETGEPTDARGRYAQAVGENFDIRDPFGSLAKAAMAEYQTFNKQQQELRTQIAGAKDPETKRMLELRREIEAHDYMAITHERLGGIARAITRGDNAIARRDDQEASRHRARAMELRAEREGRTPENEKQQNRQPGPPAQRQEKPRQEKLAEATDWDPKTRRWNEDTTQFAPIRNIQVTGNAGHNESQEQRVARQEKVKAANEAYLVATGRIKPAANGQPESKQQEREIIVARQPEETKQRAGLKNDQPMETAKAPTPEGRAIATKAEEKAATQNVIQSTIGDDAGGGGKGRDGARPRGGGRGR